MRADSLELDKEHINPLMSEFDELEVVVAQRNEYARQVRELQVHVATLRQLLEETRLMHLRYEENRDWLERRNSALGYERGG